MRTINITFDSEEEERLKKAKKKAGLTWKGIVMDWLERFEKERE